MAKIPPGSGKKFYCINLSRKQFLQYSYESKNGVAKIET